MDHDIRSRTWTVTQADKSLKSILQEGDRLFFHGEGDTCRCVCIDKNFVRRPVWDNASICEAAKPDIDNKDLGICVLRVSGAMLSTEHGPYILDIVLVKTPEGMRLYGESHAVHEAHEESLASRVAASVGKDGKALEGAVTGKLTLGDRGPLGHASGQWHADP